MSDINRMQRGQIICAARTEENDETERSRMDLEDEIDRGISGGPHYTHSSAGAMGLNQLLKSIRKEA
jgi:hypothetical protein